MNTFDKARKDVLDIIDLHRVKNNKFVYNDYEGGRQVAKSIIDHLYTCDEFLFSVAFITDGGLVKLKLALKELEERQIRGRIITTNYLFFTEPKAIRELMKMPNVEVRMYCVDNPDNYGFHTKGYIFREKFDYTAIIGSSNLTQQALTVHKEWNSELTGNKRATAIKEILDEYEKMWDCSKPVEEIIDVYEKDWKAKAKARADISKRVEEETFTPNAMQLAFIARLDELIGNNQTRGLLISATGTGKTFASAFGVKLINNLKVKKLLFITHRETILKQAKKTYELVFGNSVKTALFTGNHKDIEGAEFIFASFGLLIKEEHRNKLNPNDFDMVIIDEVHKVGDNKYQDIINYFKPKFLLGMSATPDRTDGYDIYKLFDHNIIYEIRLMEALDSNMLTPFNYFGITDLTVGGNVIDDISDFNKLIHNERVSNIIEKAEYYGYSGKRLKGLIFVSRIEEGKELSEAFNKRHYKTVFLDGSSPQNYREECIRRLEQDEKDGNELDYIFTVDIFNEGVDIPSINQVILLRPTESSIIFIQQLGRGLRLYEDKEYVVILDFIGNYQGNFYISKALSKSKGGVDDVIRTVKDILPGQSSVQFDKVAREHIYQSIDKATLSNKKIVYLEYLKLKNRLGRIPTLLEFEKYSDQPISVFAAKKVFKSYYHFLTEKEDEFKDRLSVEEASLLSYISLLILDGRSRIYINKIEELIRNKSLNTGDITDENLKDTLLNIFRGKFFKGTKAIAYNGINLIDDSNNISRLLDLSINNPLFMSFINQLIEVSYYINNTSYKQGNGLMLYQKYNRSDVMKFANLSTDDYATVFGYKLFEKQSTLPIFITYKKKLDTLASTNYEDTLLDEETLLWFTRHPRTIDSPEIKQILKYYNENNLKVLLFIQKANSKYIKNDDDSSFYYLGELSLDSYSNAKMANGSDVVKMYFSLKTPVRKDIYDYLVTPLSDDDI